MCYAHTIYINVISYIKYVVHNFFFSFHAIYITFEKFPGKVTFQKKKNLLGNYHQNLVDTNLHQAEKRHKVSVKFYVLYLLQNFQPLRTETEADRHSFLNIELVFRASKNVKKRKNRSFMKRIFFIINIEEIISIIAVSLSYVRT